MFKHLPYLKVPHQSQGNFTLPVSLYSWSSNLHSRLFCSFHLFVKSQKPGTIPAYPQGDKMNSLSSSPLSYSNKPITAFHQNKGNDLLHTTKSASHKPLAVYFITECNPCVAMFGIHCPPPWTRVHVTNKSLFISSAQCQMFCIGNSNNIPCCYHNIPYSFNFENNEYWSLSPLMNKSLTFCQSHFNLQPTHKLVQLFCFTSQKT